MTALFAFAFDFQSLLFSLSFVDRFHMVDHCMKLRHILGDQQPRKSVTSLPISVIRRDNADNLRTVCRFCVNHWATTNAIDGHAIN